MHQLDRDMATVLSLASSFSQWQLRNNFLKHFLVMSYDLGVKELKWTVMQWPWFYLITIKKIYDLDFLTKGHQYMHTGYIPKCNIAFTIQQYYRLLPQVGTHSFELEERRTVPFGQRQPSSFTFVISLNWLTAYINFSLYLQKQQHTVWRPLLLYWGFKTLMNEVKLCVFDE